MADILDAFFNNIINTLIRNLPDATKTGISLALFMVALISFNKSIRKKSELNQIIISWFVFFVLTFTLFVLYVTF